ncbi:MAG: hypothetical protein IPK87_10595 [Planctomycetes bacterium]|nr:hypothetical protein [Planctomycetota bacterium]
MIHYDATQDPAYYHQAPPALSGPPAVTLRELVDPLGMHPGPSAWIHQTRVASSFTADTRSAGQR